MFAGAAAVAALSAALPARAEPLAREVSAPRESVHKAESRGPLALVSGFAVAGISLGAGSFLLASERELHYKHAGLVVMHSGLTLAPLVAHGVGGEWRRGVLFSIPPALGGLGMLALLSVRPEAPMMGKNKSHRIFPVLITVSVLGSAVGIFDAALIDERMPVEVAAAASDDFGGVWLGGNF